jgi:hypothetical protein
MRSWLQKVADRWASVFRKALFDHRPVQRFSHADVGRLVSARRYDLQGRSRLLDRLTKSAMFQVEVY